MTTHHATVAVRRALTASLRLALDGARTVLPELVPLPVVGRIPEGRTVELGDRGTTFVIDEPGPTPDAPTVLLFHGLGTGAYLTWLPTIEALAEHHRVVAFDQRWHGRGIMSDRFSLDECADDAAALLDGLGLDRVIVAGYSMGGALAQVLAHRHPDRVAGLVLCSTAMRWHGHAGDRAFFRLLDGIEHWWDERARARVHELSAQLDAVPDVPVLSAPRDLRDWMRREFRATSPWALPVVLAELGRFDSTGWIGDLEVPVAVVVTARDRTIPTARQRQLAASTPDAVVLESPGGHTSVVFDQDRWLPTFLSAVHAVGACARTSGAASTSAAGGRGG